MIHHRNRKGKTANSKKIRRFPYIKTKKKRGHPAPHIYPLIPLSSSKNGKSGSNRRR